MIIPNKLKIGGHIVKIVFDEIDSAGISYIEDNKIVICKKMERSQQENALIHEIFHFLNTVLDADTIGHSLLDSLSNQFYQVLKDNKMLK